ncbi:hypothetical protein [Agathobaculum sp.]|uniref:hypothetical protein n=1 Tax=Agathobaculum sp. TaxID=2048138 RepID=UPI002A815DCE|nr:hypothetical protein [Agathobaculum sp.]MDY3618865.1 hypothetical protein [Agathobaculum sp.]
MRASVWSEGQEAGNLEWEPDAYGVQVSLDCVLPSDPRILLRCYGRTDGEPLLIGLPEPQNGRLRLKRHLSRETLKAAGCLHAPPREFYLSDGTAPPARKAGMEKTVPAPETSVEQRVQTGDEVLDILLRTDGVQVEQTADGFILCCQFVRDTSFALAPVFALCEVNDGIATLHWRK